MQRNQWEMPYTRAIGTIRTTVAIGGNREAKSIPRYVSKIEVTSVPGGNREAKSMGNAIILAGPCVQGMLCFFERNMFANLAAKVCQIVRNGKGREKQSAPRCVRSCEIVKGENRTIERINLNTIESPPPVESSS